MWQGGMCGGGMCDRGHAWLGVGVCMAGKGHAWQGACMTGSVHGRGRVWWGLCVPCMPPGRYYGYGIRSMSGQYASYWNAFLLTIKFGRMYLVISIIFTN